MRNKSMHAKLLSLLLTLVMVLSTAVVFADEKDNVETPDQDTSTLMDVNSESVPDDENPADTIGQKAPLRAAGEKTEVAIVVEPATATLEVGGPSTPLTVSTEIPEGASVKWESSDTGVVSVTTSGEIQGVAAGTATVNASFVNDEGNPFESEEYEYIAGSCSVTVTEPAPVVLTPTTPSGVRAATRHGAHDNGLTVSWTSDGANTVKFEILRGTSNNVNTMSVIAPNISANARSFYRLEGKGTFYYAVRAISSDGTAAVSGASGKVSISGNILTNIEELVWYSHTKKKVNIYSSANLKGKVVTLPKGTYVQAIGKSPAKVKKFKQPSKVQVRAKVGGKTYVGWLKWSQLKGGVKAATTVTYDFTPSAVEDFVNGKGYSSSTKYMIWVSPRTQRAYLLKGYKGKWVYQRNFRVTTGRFSHKTAVAPNKITSRKAKVFKVSETGRRYYYKYASYFAPGISFHTGTWWSNNKVRNTLDKKGITRTYGCIRMINSEAEWIYKNIPMNTTVVVKKDAS